MYCTFSQNTNLVYSRNCILAINTTGIHIIYTLNDDDVSISAHGSCGEMF